MPLGVTGNTSDSGSEESWFEPRRGNSKAGKRFDASGLCRCQAVGQFRCQFLTRKRRESFPIRSGQIKSNLTTGSDRRACRAYLDFAGGSDAATAGASEFQTSCAIFHDPSGWRFITWIPLMRSVTGAPPAFGVIVSSPV